MLTHATGVPRLRLGRGDVAERRVKRRVNWRVEGARITQFVNPDELGARTPGRVTQTNKSHFLLGAQVMCAPVRHLFPRARTFAFNGVRLLCSVLQKGSNSNILGEPWTGPQLPQAPVAFSSLRMIILSHS